MLPAVWFLNVPLNDQLGIKQIFLDINNEKKQKTKNKNRPVMSFKTKVSQRLKASITKPPAAIGGAGTGDIVQLHRIRSSDRDCVSSRRKRQRRCQNQDFEENTAPKEGGGGRRGGLRPVTQRCQAPRLVNFGFCRFYVCLRRHNTALRQGIGIWMGIWPRPSSAHRASAVFS